MHFQHAPEIWGNYPELVPGVMFAKGITPDARVADGIARFTDLARTRLEQAPESEFPEIQAWRRAFARMGLKPTQYRCAAESLLRRFRKEGSLPSLHPMVDLCNAISLAFAIPIAIFDVTQITGQLEVRYAGGGEEYLTFAGDTEHPDAGEVIFADAADRAHARRWTNRQSGRSAVRNSTTAVLVVAEAMHEEASADVPQLITEIAAELSAGWGVKPVDAVLTAALPRFTFLEQA